MSGGIDSTVAAMMLHDQGYEVIGVTMKTWDYASSGGGKKETGCCSLESLQDARRVAVDLGFHHFILDLREEFGESVIDNFVDEYIAGRTPNPCIMCNTHIKWNALLKRANALDCELIATGHYASIHQENNRFFVKKAMDENKDQSYVLWGLSQECLSRTRFPIADFRKPEIRKMAYDRGYADLAKKSESYEICFIPDNDYRSFLKRRKPQLVEELGTGLFINAEGQVIGEHQGYPFFTIGQRKGLGKAFGKPMFVSEIRPETNTVVLSEEGQLGKTIMKVGKVNWQKIAFPEPGKDYLVKIRYKDRGHAARLYLDAAYLVAEFALPVNSIAPGQSAVVYDDQDLICGGIIQKSTLEH